MSTIEDRLHQRNREIGRTLEQNRKQRQRSVTECATLLATSRRRYSAIEQGATAVSAAELEVLIEYLNIPRQTFWLDNYPQVGTQNVVVQASPGKTVQVVVEVQG